MPSRREQIEAVIEAKFDPNGDGSHLVSQKILQYPVNDYELSLIKGILGATSDTFTDEFYNVKNDTYLRWDAVKGEFYNILTGEEYFMSLFYDQFDDPVQSALDWTFANSATSVNDWAFGTDALDIGKSNGMYISNDGGTTNAYSNDSGVSHSSRDEVIPAGDKVKVKIRLKSNGEPGFDDFRVFVYNTATVPVADVLQPLVNQELIVTGDSVFTDFEFELDNTYTNTTITVSLQWRADGSISGQPPAHIAEFEILYK